MMTEYSIWKKFVALDESACRDGKIKRFWERNNCNFYMYDCRNFIISKLWQKDERRPIPTLVLGSLSTLYLVKMISVQQSSNNGKN